MRLQFRPITIEEYPLAEEFKRATVRDGLGCDDDDQFNIWFPPEKSYAAFLEKSLALDADSCVFARVNGEVVGGLHLIMKEGAGHLNNIYLKPEWRGQKLGDELVAYALAFFARHGATYATLKTNPKQPKSLAFYERLGWRVTDTDVRFGMVEMRQEL